MTQHEFSFDLGPCLVLAHNDLGFACRVSRQFRLLGWNVHLARTGADVRRLAQKLNPAVVAIDVDLVDESGWLVCDKLNREQAGCKVVLIAAQQNPEYERLASFVGAAALIWQQDGISALVHEVLEAALPAAG